KKVMETEIADLEAQMNAQADEIKKIGDTLAEKSKALDEAKTANQTLSIVNARLEERVKAADERTQELRRELDKLHDRLRELAAAKPEPAAPDSRKKDVTREK
ncbi:MAG: hypothetical protein ACRERU_06030, partial [Methylococcales bacterium]